MIAVQILHKDIGSFLQSRMFNRDIRHTVFDIFQFVHVVGGFQILFSLSFTLIFNKSSSWQIKTFNSN